MALKHITNDNDFIQELENQDNKYIVIDFYADWCAPCKMFAPIFEKVANEIPEVTFLKINVETAPMSATKFDVRAIPTIVFMDKEKNGVKAASGVLSEEVFKELVNKLKDGKIEEM